MVKVTTNGYKGFVVVGNQYSRMCIKNGYGVGENTIFVYGDDEEDEKKFAKVMQKLTDNGHPLSLVTVLEGHFSIYKSDFCYKDDESLLDFFGKYHLYIKTNTKNLPVFVLKKISDTDIGLDV